MGGLLRLVATLLLLVVLLVLVALRWVEEGRLALLAPSLLRGFASLLLRLNHFVEDLVTAPEQIIVVPRPLLECLNACLFPFLRFVSHKLPTLYRVTLFIHAGHEPNQLPFLTPSY